MSAQCSKQYTNILLVVSMCCFQLNRQCTIHSNCIVSNANMAKRVHTIPVKALCRRGEMYKEDKTLIWRWEPILQNPNNSTRLLHVSITSVHIDLSAINKAQTLKHVTPTDVSGKHFSYYRRTINHALQMYLPWYRISFNHILDNKLNS